MSEPTRPGASPQDGGRFTLSDRQRRINEAAADAPFMDDLDEDFDPREPTGEVFKDGEVPGVQAFPWQEKPQEGWPEGYNPFAVPQTFEPTDEELDVDVEPDWEAIEIEARERGYEEGYTAGHEAGLPEGREAGHAEGFAEGRAAGHAEGFAAGVAEAQSAFDRVGDAVQDLRAVGAELEARYVRAAVELATRIADRVVGVRLSETPEVLVRQVGSAIRRFRGIERCQIQVHPEDVPLLEAAIELRRGADGVVEVVVEADPSIRRGGWRVHTEMGGVDGTLEERLEAVLEAVGRVEAKWDEPSAQAVIDAVRADLAAAADEPTADELQAVAEPEDDDAPLD